MPTILLTGGRAPVALDLARMFADAGHRVIMAESLPGHLSRPSRAIARSYDVPPPRYNPSGFTHALCRIADRESVDLLIPTCEEVFWIARSIHSIEAATNVFTVSLQQLDVLHNKFLFNQRAQAIGLAVPYTRLITARDELEIILADGGEWVFKPVYSRFASRTIILPKGREAIARIGPSPEQPWAAQTFVPGRQLCTYSVAQSGQLVAHCTYPALFTAGQGAAVHFEAVEHPAILEWVSRFVEAEAYTGQISFDFIETTQGNVYALECNPRATSGLHLFRASAAFTDRFFAADADCLFPATGTQAMLSTAMLLYALPAALAGGQAAEWWHAFQGSRDVLFDRADPLPALLQWRMIGHYILQGKQHGLSPLAASTLDIEWNGECLD